MLLEGQAHALKRGIHMLVLLDETTTFLLEAYETECTNLHSI